jgi:hypothetical protein
MLQSLDTYNVVDQATGKETPERSVTDAEEFPSCACCLLSLTDQLRASYILYVGDKYKRKMEDAVCVYTYIISHIFRISHFLQSSLLSTTKFLFSSVEQSQRNPDRLTLPNEAPMCSGRTLSAVGLSL